MVLFYYLSNKNNSLYHLNYGMVVLLPYLCNVVLVLEYLYISAYVLVRWAYLMGGVASSTFSHKHSCRL